MKIRKNQLVPINTKLNSLKKSKVQFSTRLSGCVGEHQSQEFFHKVNISRQSGICSKSNSFAEKRSNSFRQTLQLNIPFVADFSDSKLFCICYPVHFFRKKLHSYDSEDNRFASIRIYFPATRMKTGNDFRVSLDMKKRLHIPPFKFEFVSYSSLLTLPLEDLSLAVFRAKSSSEKFKISSSLAIPKILISQSISISQTGSPIFIGTEKIYSRIVKLITCSQSDAFKLHNISTAHLDSKLHLRKCILKWIGLQDFLPSSSRLIFVRHVSSDCGLTLGASILNSPGPKIRRSRIKENERLSICLKPTKPEHSEECDEVISDMLCNEQLTSPFTNEIQNNKRPRGRPKKLFDKSNSPALNTAETANIPLDSLQLKSESTSNSMTDSTSEEKFSVQFSSSITPDTDKSCSPIILSDTITTTVCSLTSVRSPGSAIQVMASNTTKNKRGRPRKYPLSASIERQISRDRTNKSTVQDINDVSLRNRKQHYIDVSMEQSNKMPRSSNSSVTSDEIEYFSKMLVPEFDYPTNTCYIHSDDDHYINRSIWKPLKHPLPAPDPIVPFISGLSNTGLNTERLIKTSNNNHMDNSPTYPFHQRDSSHGQNVISDCNSSHHYQTPGGAFNPLVVPSSAACNSGLLSSTMANQFHLNNSLFGNYQTSIIDTLSSLFSPLTQTQTVSMSSSLFYDHCYRQLLANSHSNIPCHSFQPSRQSILQHQPYNHSRLPNKYDPLYSNLSWKY